MLVIDLETTGTSSTKNCMVSLGAVDYETDNSFYGECHIYDTSEVEPIALQINGFTHDQIYDKTKPAAHELYQDFLEWSKSIKDNKILAGHNVGHFDILFLEELHSYLPNNIKFPFSYRTVDIHTLGFFHFRQSLKLDDLGAKLGLEPEPKPHNALTGALYGKSVLQKLLEYNRISFGGEPRFTSPEAYIV